MRIRLLGHYWFVPLLLLWVAESLAALSTYNLAALLSNSPAHVADPLRLDGIIFGACIMVMMVAMGLFSRRLRDRMAGIVLRISASVVAGAALAALLTALVPRYALAPQLLLLAAAIAWMMLVLVRTVARGLIDQEIFKQAILVIGAGVNAGRILELRRREDQRGFRVLGFVPIAGEALLVPVDRRLQSTGTLAQLARELEVDEIVVAMDDRRQQFPLRDLLDCRLAGIRVTELLSFLEREAGKVYTDMMNPSWLIFGEGFRRDWLRRFTERSFDLLASTLLLVLAAPFMLLTAIAIKLEDGFRAPVFYHQLRVGLGGSTFRVHKFRSMRVDAEKDGRAQWATKNDSRVTRVGGFIRKIRLDELPQLANVFRGDMSFVGPRPERPEFVQRLNDFIPYYAERHTVKPGLTGWAQLCYPYGASDKDAIEKLQYDLYYVKHHSLMFDLLILLQTVEVILFGKGAR